MAARTIAIVGATGAQGGGLVGAITADRSGEFAARALTRSPGSAKAAALAAAGVEVVAADTDDVESLKRAFDGADAVFCLTNYWEHFSVEREQAQARNMAAAAKAAGVRHAIWSTLEDTRKWVPLDDDRMPTLHGRYKVPHFDSKGEADQFFRDAGVPTTFLLTSFYWDNFIFFGLGPKPGPDGVLAITLPMDDRKLPGIAAGDIGACALRRAAPAGPDRQDRRHCRRAPDGRRDGGGADQGARADGALQRRAAGGLPRLRLSRRRRPRQHVPVQARLQRLLLRGARSRVLALAAPAAAELRRVAGRAQGADSAVGSRRPGRTAPR